MPGEPTDPASGTTGQGYRVERAEKVVVFVCLLWTFGLVTYLVVRNEPFTDPNITLFVKAMLAGVLSVLAALVPGYLHVSWHFGGFAVRAGGAIGVFVLIWFGSPEVLPSVATASSEGVELLGEILAPRSCPTPDADETDCWGDVSAREREEAVRAYVQLQRRAGQNADLSEANLDFLDFFDANLSGITLVDSSMRGTISHRVNLSYATLRDADLSVAMLRGADLRHAELDGVDMTLAILDDADLTGANVEGGKWDLVSWSGTTCPSGRSADELPGHTCLEEIR